MSDPMMHNTHPPDFGPLFKAKARRTDPRTSHAAAREYDASGSHVNHAVRILIAVVANPGATAEQLAEATHLHISQVNRRSSELEFAKLIRRTDDGGKYLRWWPCDKENTP